MTAPHVLVTGSCGLIGSEVSVFFANQGFRVSGIDSNHRAVFFGPEGDTSWVLERLRQDAVRAKRDPQSIAIAYWAPWYKETQTPIIDDGKRQLFTGSDDNVADDIRAFRELGVSSLLFNFARASLAESLVALERFVAEVVPRAT